MSRYVMADLFQLYMCPLQDAHRRGLAGPVKDKYFPTLPTPTIPVALRWSTHPTVGFPRQPFNVYRRPRNPVASVVIFQGPVNVAGTSKWVPWTFPLTSQEMFEVTFVATPALNSSLTVEAISKDWRPIPGQKIIFTTNGNGRFRCPGIAALRVSGSGSISMVRGVDQVTFANLPDWKRIEVVGFPFKAGEIAGPVYNPLPQGFEAPAKNGYDAAMTRLDIARMLQTPPPPTGVVNVPAPSWAAPLPAPYLGVLRQANPSPMAWVRNALAFGKDAEWAPRQYHYVVEIPVDGIKQAGIPNAPETEPSKAKMPAVAVVMSQVTMDSSAATGLGYGTIDMPPTPSVPPSAAGIPVYQDPVIPGGTVPYDYMVVTIYTFPGTTWPPIGQPPENNTFEVAALAQLRPAPETPLNVAAAVKQLNRPPELDQPATASVRVRWAPPALMQSYGLIVSRQSNQSIVLNTARTAAVGGYEPYIAYTPRPDPEIPADQLMPSFTEQLAPVPFSGSAQHSYFAIGIDVFARWSDWAKATNTVSPAAVQVPQIMRAEFKLPVVAGAQITGDLHIEFAWDWEDRSPLKVEFVSRFYTGAVPASAPVGFAFSNAPGVGPLVVSFDPVTGNPSVPNPHAIDKLTSQSTDGETRKYRLVVKNVTCDFSASETRPYAIWARGFEKVRPAAAAGLYCAPKAIKALDPRPVPPSYNPVVIQWTALPDPTGRARGILTWTKSTAAKGYFVWQATETAVLAQVNNSSLPASGTPLLTRAETLRSLVTGANKNKSLAAFTRLNSIALDSDRMEIELPSGANTLFAYRVSSTSKNNVESERSDQVAIFCVPRRNVPGQPRLILRRSANPGGIQIIAIPGPGAAPAGYRVFRIRREALAGDVGSMGPAKIATNAPGWADYTLAELNGDGLEGKSIVDTVTESWQPYFYRIVAVGAEDDDNGEYTGESLASAVQREFRPPSSPPTLVMISSSWGDGHFVLHFQSNLPVKESPLGTAHIIVSTTQVDNPLNPRRMIQTEALHLKAHEVQMGTLSPIPSPTQQDFEKMPELRRGHPNQQGVVSYYLRITGDIISDTRTLTVIDPLGRRATLLF